MAEKGKPTGSPHDKERGQVDPREKGEILSYVMLSGAVCSTGQCLWNKSSKDCRLHCISSETILPYVGDGEEKQTSKTYEPGKLGFKKYI